MTTIDSLPSFSRHLKRGAEIIALALVIQNPDGELIMVRPDDISGFHIDVETTWQGVPFGSEIESQVGHVAFDFKVLGIMKTRPAEGPDRETRRPGVWLPGMVYELVEK
jgi:hypothetical protein